MEIQKYIHEKKQIYDVLLKFKEEEDSNEEYEKICKLLKEHNIQENRTEFLCFLKILLRISDYHHRQPGFFERIKRILLYVKDNITQTMSNDDIYFVPKQQTNFRFFIQRKIYGKIYSKKNGNLYLLL